MTDPTIACLDAMAQQGQPAPLYRAVDSAMRALIGYKLFTMMVVAPPGDRVRRVYTTNAKAYPVGGYKTNTETPWGKVVITGMQPYIGRNADDIRWAFADHELIASLGLESVLNVPVLWDGRCIGSLNLLDAAGHYRPEHAVAARPIAQLLVGAFLEEVRA
jgi:GAF domain-containing protein